MRVLHINTHDSGGAAVAAYRLHQGLLKNKIDSRFLVLYSAGRFKDVNVFSPKPFTFAVKKISNRLFRHHRLPAYSSQIEIFTSPDTLYNLLENEHYKAADIVHFHWVANFVDYKTFFSGLNKPLVWTFHDKNPIDGGFHYDIDKLSASEDLKSVNKIYEGLKLKALERKKVHTITPSAWLRNEIMKSKFRNIFNKVDIIPYGLDNSIFYPMDRKQAKHMLGLQPDKPWFLIIATNLSIYRKGFDILLELMEHMKEVNFIIIGKAAGFGTYDNVKYLGMIKDDDTLRVAYNAADAMLLSSREDNLPNVMLESLMCGTPVIGFPVGGANETIISGVNGMLASAVSARELIAAINEFLKNLSLYDHTCISREAIRRFSLLKQAEEVTNLYQRAINDFI